MVYRRWPVHRWSCRDLLVVSPAEGATRRSVTVSRDRPAPQPCGSKNRYVLNCDGRKKSNGASHFTQSEDCDQLQRAESCQPGRCLYASVSQERSNLLDLRESPFKPLTQWSFACHSRSPARISVHSAGVFNRQPNNSTNPKG